jgi:phosphopantothenoylcysteine decarboxylase/phosphopantothenate--cysteine ligase
MKTQAKIDFFYTMPYNEAEKQCLMPETPARNLLNMKERGHYMLKGKTVLLAVTGSIAAYKIAYLASSLKKLDADVHVLMTENATNFINPITFETLTGNKCLVDTFDRNFEFSVEHVSLAKKADVVMIAPASANVIGKIAHGIADDMLTTTVMACRCRKIVAPAMNTNMYENPIVQDNLKILKKYGYEVIAPAEGYLACGDTGAGKMPEPQLLLEYILRETACEKDMKGLKVLVTAGPTQEPIDPVRFITNHSTGKMGYAIATVCMRRGAEVTLVSGPTAVQKPEFVNIVPVTTAREMFEEVTSRADEQDIIIKAAAVADYRPKNVSSEKVKKTDGELSMEMERTDDILAYLGSHRRPGQFLCGFSMETENVLENSRKKLKKKNLDMIAANSLKVEGAGFGGDTNVITIITEDEEVSLELMSKEEAASKILDQILARRTKKED